MRFFRKTLLLILIFCPTVVFSHPLGGRVFGHRLILAFSPKNLKVAYTVEVPLSYMVRSGVSEGRLVESAGGSLMAELDGRPIKLVLADSSVEDGEPFFKDVAVLLAHEWDLEGEHVLVLSNSNFLREPGAFLDSVSAKDIEVISSSVPRKAEWSKENARRDIEVRFRVRPGEELPVEDHGMFGGTWTQEIKGATGWKWIALLFMTVMWGALHALSPGHGKSLAAAYLVGRSGSVMRALQLSLITTASHVMIVLVLGAVLFLIRDEISILKITPYIKLAGGIAITLIGVWLFFRKVNGDGHDHSRSILSLGIAGGAIPCPSALVILIAAASLGRPLAGIVLVVFFSAGLAAVLFMIGALTVLGRDIISRRFAAFEKFLPRFSAVLITTIGLALVISFIVT